MKRYHENMKGILLVSEKLFDHLCERDDRLEELESMINVDRITNTLIRKDRDTFLNDNKRLREALKFYADNESYVRSEDDIMTGYPPEVMNDRGYKARKALEENK